MQSGPCVAALAPALTLAPANPLTCAFCDFAISSSTATCADSAARTQRSHAGTRLRCAMSKTATSRAIFRAPKSPANTLPGSRAEGRRVVANASVAVASNA